MQDGIAAAFGLLVTILVLMVWDQLTNAVGAAVTPGTRGIVIVVALIVGLAAYMSVHKDRSV